jgi:hypothetical protein
MKNQACSCPEKSFWQDTIISALQVQKFAFFFPTRFCLVPKVDGRGSEPLHPTAGMLLLEKEGCGAHHKW